MATSTDAPRGVVTLLFDPDLHPHTTLKAFNEFVDQYEFRYNAQYPQPPKALKEDAIADWKAAHEGNDPNAAQTKTIVASLKSRDKVQKLLGFFSTVRFQQDWKAAEPNPALRECDWETFGQSQMKCIGSVTIQVIFSVLKKNWVHFLRLIVEVFIFW